MAFAPPFSEGNITFETREQGPRSPNIANSIPSTAQTGKLVDVD